MRTILVTGGAGFIGGEFVRQAAAGEQTRIVTLDALTYAGNLDNLESVLDNPRHRFVQGDIGDKALVARLLAEEQPSAVVNFAAESHVDRSIDDPGAFVRTNVVGTWTLLEAALDYWRGLTMERAEKFRFLQVSTDEVYGSLGPEGKFMESTSYAPNSPYAASKAAADHFVRAYHHTFGLPALITNCSNNYGPYQFPEKLIPLTISKALAGEPIPVYGDGAQVRDWLYVGDHCEALALALDWGRPGEVYNIGGDSERTNLEVVKTICAILNRLAPASPHRPHEKLITFVKDRPGHDRRYAIDFSKLRAELGWMPRETFESGLERTVGWYLENRAWVERALSGAYRGERLGLGGVGVKR